MELRKSQKHLSSLKEVGPIIAVSYRPFDDRFTLWDNQVLVHRRERISQLLLSKRSAIVVSRQSAAIGATTFDSAFVVNSPVDFNFFRRGGEYIFPAYINRDVEAFAVDFRDDLDARYDHHYTPDEILGYIYAVLYAPTYRSRYAEFLRIDFPRIPFPKAKPEFDRLSDLGWALVQAHLLKAVPKPTPRLGRYHGRGDHAVEQPRWSPAEQAVWINGSQRFAPVPEAVWQFHIGGYQVLDKYLKSRKGRTLSLDEIEHIGKVAEALAFTIAQMAEIDEAYRVAFSGDNAEAPLATST